MPQPFKLMRTRHESAKTHFNYYRDFHFQTRLLSAAGAWSREKHLACITRHVAMGNDRVSVWVSDALALYRTKIMKIDDFLLN